MADVFAGIASHDIQTARKPLVPSPAPSGNGVCFPLAETDRTPDAMPKKMETAEELAAEIERLKTRYKPFLADCAAPLPCDRKKKELSSFSYRVATDYDLSHLPAILAGEGEWETVSVPHYGGPVGRATAYYRTAFRWERRENRSVWLHFDGVDYIAKVFLNGNFVGMHEGFFAPFEWDVTRYLCDGENTLLVCVENDFVYGGNNAPTYENERLEGDKLYAATGPGFDDPESGWHHCPPGMGIYQRVYLEERSSIFLSDLWVRPLPATSEYEIWCTVYNGGVRPPEDEVKIAFSVCGKNFSESVLSGFSYTPSAVTGVPDGGTVSAEDISALERDGKLQKAVLYTGENRFRIRFRMESPHLWNGETPYLYEAQARLLVGGAETDSLSSTFGMRDFRMGTEAGKNGMFFLNGESLRLRGANTMGYEQQDVMRGDDEQLLYDMLMAKACHMNFLRITQRPVQKEIYEICDRIGLMIQTDLPLFTNLRRTKFAEAIRQAEDMEKLIRSHACTILSTYINEPFANASGKPHRHFVRQELEDFFVACDKAVLLQNPDRVIKHIDGDYDPPSTDLPDYHTYTMWYNGHGIDMGRLHRGEWLDLPEGWYGGCGEYGAEGLDPVPLMRKHYPASWLPQSAEEEKTWTPSGILGSQSGNMFYFFYDRPDTLSDWVTASGKHQVTGTKIQTEAFRRNAAISTFAIHLFIDAFPAGWMKAIVDCERRPKPAFFAYRDALTPLMVNLRTDRFTCFSGETVTAELWICNDTHEVSFGHTVSLELLCGGRTVAEGQMEAKFGENAPFLQGTVTVTAPETDGRESVTLRAALKNASGDVLHYYDLPITVFAREEADFSPALFVGTEEYEKRKDELLALVSEGKTLIVTAENPGDYEIGGSTVHVKRCGMRPVHFVSRKTGHELVTGFQPDDFRFWYGDKEDRITPIARMTFLCDGFTPVLTSGNSLTASAWGQPLYPALCLAEKSYGRGKIVVSTVDFDGHLQNPVARIMKNRLAKFH